MSQSTAIALPGRAGYPVIGPSDRWLSGFREVHRWNLLFTYPTRSLRPFRVRMATWLETYWKAKRLRAINRAS